MASQKEFFLTLHKTKLTDELIAREITTLKNAKKKSSK